MDFYANRGLSPVWTSTKMESVKKLKTEDLGKMLEYAVCLAISTPFDGVYRYSVEDAQKLKDRLLPVRDRLAGFVHTGKKSHLYDFQNETSGGHLSVKSNKKGWKVCPQIIGQTTQKKFRQAFSLADDIPVKPFVESHLEQLLNEYASKTFHSPILYYNQKENVLGMYKQVGAFQWGELRLSRSGDAWKESSTLYATRNGKTKTIGEFQIHTYRDAVKFRFDFKNLYELYSDAITLELF